jgi:hypothetical protein
MKNNTNMSVVTAEKAKISNGKETYARVQKKTKQKDHQTIHRLITSEDPESMEADLDLTEEEIIANHKIRNARSHKNRLHGLRNFEDN